MTDFLVAIMQFEDLQNIGLSVRQVSILVATSRFFFWQTLWSMFETQANATSFVPSYGSNRPFLYNANAFAEGS